MTRSCQTPRNIKQGEQVKIKALLAALYPKKNNSSYHSVLVIFLKLVEITLSVFASKNKTSGWEEVIFESPSFFTGSFLLVQLMNQHFNMMPLIVY